MKPACMTQTEYETWQTANDSMRWQASSPCSDCRLEWALEQESKGACLIWNGCDYVLGTPSGDGTPLTDAERQRRSGVRRHQRSVDYELPHQLRMKDAWTLHEAGRSTRQIARQMDVHRNTVARYIREMRAANRSEGGAQ